MVTFRGEPALERRHPAHLPSSEQPALEQAAGVPEEGQLVDAAEHESMRHVPARPGVVAENVEVVDDGPAPVRVVGHVERPRPGVVRIQREPVRHPAPQHERERVVIGDEIVLDHSDTAEVGIRPARLNGPGGGRGRIDEEAAIQVLRPGREVLDLDDR